MHPVTARSYDIEAGDLVDVSSPIGSIKVIAVIDKAMAKKQLFVPIHWNDQYSSMARVDTLVAPITDAISGQPELKYTCANITKVNTQAWAIIVSRNQLDCAQFINWNASPLGQGQGYLYQIAIAANFNWPDFIANKRLHEQGPAQAYEHFSDHKHNDQRLVCFSDQQVELAIYSHQDSNQLPSASFMRDLFTKPVANSYWPLLSSTTPSSGKLICSCFKVSEEAIQAAIEAGATSAQQLGQKLKCGTNCGSCIPELNSMLLVR